jgi:membrane protease YdiL (CAAX protease family)
MEQRNEAFPSALEATFLIVGLFAVELLIGAALHDVKSISGIDLSDVSGVIAVLGNGVLFSALLHYKRMSYASLFHSSKTSVVATVGILAVPILCIVPGITLAVWTFQSVLEQLFPLARWQQAMFDQMMSNGLAAVVTGCVIAPVLEEMLFRGIILRSFLHRYSRRDAILASAFLFGLAHLNIYQFAVGVGLGIILGWLYERTRSLWPCILLHSSYNSLVSTIYFALKSQELGQGWQPSVAFWAIAFTFAFFGTLLLQRLLISRRAES